MATAGQLKAKIDLLKKKIADKAASLPLEQRRRLSKRLRRLQRSRRVAVARETQGKARAKAAPEVKEAGGAPA